MIVDSSAIVAVVLVEPEEEQLLEALFTAPRRAMSAATWLEVFIVIENRLQAGAVARTETFLKALEIEIVPVSVEHAQAARLAHQRFGRGRHPARLNFGDCFAYALAKVTGEPLLFKGSDFGQTDITPALKA